MTKKIKVSEYVYSQLRKRLSSGFYNPGTQLREEQVADDLNVSRTPVRESFHKLISEGLLEQGNPRGALVSQWKIEDAEEVFSIRMLLESKATELAAVNASEQQRQEMEELCTLMNKALALPVEDARPTFHELNHKFHSLILESANSPRLETLSLTMLEIPMVLGGYYIYTENDIQQSVFQHNEILAGILAKNKAWAHSAMISHLSAALEKFKQHDKSKKAQSEKNNS